MTVESLSDISKQRRMPSRRRDNTVASHEMDGVVSATFGYPTKFQMVMPRPMVAPIATALRSTAAGGLAPSIQANTPVHMPAMRPANTMNAKMMPRTAAVSVMAGTPYGELLVCTSIGLSGREVLVRSLALIEGWLPSDARRLTWEPTLLTKPDST